MSDKDIKALKEEADKLGVKYANSISYDVLSARVEDAKKTMEENKTETTKEKTTTKKAKPENKAITGRKKASRLIRARVSCKNPNKQNLQGDYFSAGNPNIGFIKKYVFFNDVYHIPEILLNVIKSKRYQRVQTRKENGKDVIKASLQPEYDVEILKPLTPEELKDLAQRQTAKGLID